MYYLNILKSCARHGLGVLKMLRCFNRILISLILAMVTVPFCHAQLLTSFYKVLKNGGLEKPDSAALAIWGESYKQLIAEESTKPEPTFGIRNQSDSAKIEKINKQLESYDQLVTIQSSKANTTFGFELEREIYIPDLSSYYNSTDSIPTNMGIVYNKGLNYILGGKDKKAYQYFEKMLKKEKVSWTNIEHAAYQLAHYDWYNCFDKYYNGLPSNMPRENLISVMPKHKRHGFEKANGKACLLMCANPNLPSYNLKNVVNKGSYFLCSKNYKEEQFGRSVFNTACDTALTCTFSLYDIFREFDYSGGSLVYPSHQLSDVIQRSKTLPYLSRMKQSSPTSDVGKTARELYTMAEELRKKGDFDKPFYYYTRAALFGDIKSFVRIYEIQEENIRHYFKEADIQELYLVVSGLDLAKGILDHKEFAEYHDLAKKVYESRKQIRDDYDKRERDAKIAQMAQKEARRQRRLRFWSGVLQSVAQSVNTTMNQMAMVQQSPFTSVQNPVRTNMDYLIDLRYTIAQSNVKEYQEYQAVREEYQRMGKDLTIDEWRTMQGQAIQNLKNQGYDIIAEQRKITEDNKVFNEEMRQRERQDRLKQYNAQLGGGSSVVSNSTITSQNRKTTSNTTMDVSTTKQEVGRTNTEKLDSKEQYKRERVASDDYHFVKHVNLYIRDGNSNRVMFSNKDLCKKGSRYYIKINSMYYLVQTNGGWGFNSSILYSHSKLYFNK